MKRVRVHEGPKGGIPLIAELLKVIMSIKRERQKTNSNGSKLWGVALPEPNSAATNAIKEKQKEPPNMHRRPNTGSHLEDMTALSWLFQDSLHQVESTMKPFKVRWLACAKKKSWKTMPLSLRPFSLDKFGSKWTWPEIRSRCHVGVCLFISEPVVLLVEASASGLGCISYSRKCRAWLCFLKGRRLFQPTCNYLQTWCRYFPKIYKN